MQDSEALSSPQRLIHATLEIWRARGNAGVSARLLGQEAGLPVSSIYHHFGSLEQLFASAQEDARARAERWCATRLDAFAAADSLTVEALPALMAALIDDWAQDQRLLAFAWRESMVMAARDSHYLPAVQGWQALWREFWREICARCGLAAASEITSLMFCGEGALHLMQWRRPVDRAGLDETCRGWGEWLAGRLTPEGPWRHFARTEASRAMPELTLRGDTAERIATAAADTVEELGMAGLTHRAVAARAGLTLGVVSYNFRTSADLARAAFEAIYRRIVPSAASPQARLVPDAPAAFEALVGYDILSPRLAAMDEVMATVARDAELGPFAPQLRYLRGRTAGSQLQGLVGPDRLVSPADAALLSAFSGGQRFACLGMEETEMRLFLRRTLGDVTDMLGAQAALKPSIARNRHRNYPELP